MIVKENLYLKLNKEKMIEEPQEFQVIIYHHRIFPMINWIYLVFSTVYKAVVSVGAFAPTVFEKSHNHT